LAEVRCVVEATSAEEDRRVAQQLVDKAMGTETKTREGEPSLHP
jgi:hypothetical protein